MTEPLDAHPNWNQTPPNACPYCNAPNDGWTSTEGAHVERPQAGAVSLCFMCGGLCVYEDETTLRKATDEESAAWDADPLVVRTRKILSYTDSPNLASSLMLMQS